MNFKKIKEKINFENLLIFFIIIQPIIDALTTLCIEHISAKLTIGILVRTLFMIVVSLYALYIIDKKDKIKLFSYYFLIGIYIIIYWFLLFKQNGMTLFFEQIKSTIKTFYFPIVLSGLYYIIKKKKINIDNKNYCIALFGYTFCMLLSRVLDIAMKTYKYGFNKGTVGLFYSANEIGAIIGTLFIFVMLEFLKDKKDKFNIIALTLSILAILEMGTKVPFLAVIGLLIFVLGYNIIKNKIEKKKIFNLLNKGLLIILILIYLIAGYMPLGKNINSVYGKVFPSINLNIFGEEEKEEEKGNKFNNLEEFGTAAVSSRDGFFKNTKKRYDKANITMKIFGIGYIMNNDDGYLQNVKLIEMDYFDIFFNHGVIGSIVYYIPLLILIINILLKCIVNIKNLINNINILILGYGLCISLGMALLAGHVLTSPAVSIFVALIVIKLNNEVNKLEKNKIS